MIVVKQGKTATIWSYDPMIIDELKRIIKDPATWNMEKHNGIYTTINCDEYSMFVRMVRECIKEVMEEKKTR